jgi:hypothetical protein
MIIKEDQVKLLMDKLKVNRIEAIDILKYDDQVNKGKPTEYDLTPDQMSNVHNLLRRVEHANAKGGKHTMKQNVEKEDTIYSLANFLVQNTTQHPYDNVIMTNKSREITFSIGEKDYTLTLIEKRRPKK